jgi:hypothetical protein
MLHNLKDSASFFLGWQATYLGRQFLVGGWYFCCAFFLEVGQSAQLHHHAAGAARHILILFLDSFILLSSPERERARIVELQDCAHPYSRPSSRPGIAYGPVAFRSLAELAPSAISPSLRLPAENGFSTSCLPDISPSSMP